MIRDDIKAAQIAAMKARDAVVTQTTRLILAAIKNRDIEARTGQAPADDDALVVEVLNRMGKQRRESIELYANAGRADRAGEEERELAIIERFLPQRMDETETRAAIDAIATELGAAGPKDMGRVMAELKARHGTSLDMAKASELVKARLAGG